MFYFS